MGLLGREEEEEEEEEEERPLEAVGNIFASVTPSLYLFFCKRTTILLLFLLLCDVLSAISFSFSLSLSGSCLELSLSQMRVGLLRD